MKFTKTLTLFFLMISAALIACSGGDPAEEGSIFLLNRLGDAEANFDRVRFRSIRSNGRIVDDITLNGETRRSFIPPLPSQFAFDVELPTDAVLEFSIAVATTGQSKLPAPVEFRVSIDPGKGEEFVVEEASTVSRPNQWLHQELDLSRWSGLPVRLTLKTLPRGSRREGQLAQQLIAAWGHPVLRGGRRRDDRPNLILISIDCLRADHVGVYGYEKQTTPNIDRLADDSVVFERAASTSSWTLPTHMSMLTGLRPSFHGVVSRYDRLSNAVPYLPQTLSEYGYETKGVAAWVFVSQTYGFHRGYNDYRVLKMPKAEQVIDEALDLVRSARSHNQFLFIHLLDPHMDYLPPQEYIGKFGEPPTDISGLLKMVYWGKPPGDPGQIKALVNLYDGEVAYVDQQLGRLFDTLKDMGLYDSSLIILTADHGEAFYEHGLWQHGESLYEEVIHIPMIVKWPNGSPSGRENGLVSQSSIFATVLEAAGIAPVTAPSAPSLGLHEVDEKTEGAVSVVSELTWAPLGRRGSWPPPGTAMMISLREGSLKYIATLAEASGDKSDFPEYLKEELYDLGADPGERRDLSQDRPEKLDSFRQALLAYFLEVEASSFQSERDVHIDENMRRMLESLGYTRH